jgi:hypothetical protein
MTTPKPTGDALKACPFCGGQAEYANNPMQGLLCVSCGSKAYWTKWQARTPPPVSLDEVAETVSKLLADDPVCYGRVSTGTVRAIANLLTRQ